MGEYESPRWGGLHAEKDSGEIVEIPVPPTLQNDGLNVRIQGSNIAFTRYLDLFQTAARILGFNARYFQEPVKTSNVQDAEKYARLHRDSSGPVHGRDGPIVNEVDGLVGELYGLTDDEVEYLKEYPPNYGGEYGRVEPEEDSEQQELEAVTDD